MDSPKSSFNGAYLREDDGGERLIIGLDFGTTYSGVAYAFTTQPDRVYVIDEWPGAKGRTSPKCPTLAKYVAPHEFKWGFELDRTTKERIEGIKLLLDPDQPKPLYVPAVNTKTELKRLGKPAVDVASDYISAIFNHALAMIESKYPKNYLQLLDKQYVLSVPAVWSDKAKDATMRAARNAGITPVKLIKEPEAAALYTLHSMGAKGLEVGDALVLCDAGGGTVDLISYEIKSLQPFELVELTVANGGVAGSLMLNKRFEEWVKTVVGERAYLDLREHDSYRLAMKTFNDNIKPGFRDSNDEEQYVTFPKANLKDDPNRGLKSDTITVTGDTLHDIFEPIFTDIDKLVNEQVTNVRLKRLKSNHRKGSDVKAILLVGGFGSSSYLHEKIASSHPDVQVIQPNDAWSAIVRGAVMSQLPSEARVTTNIAPKHYGVLASSKFDPERDEGQAKFYDEFKDTYRCHVMTWYINKGEDLIRSRQIEFSFYRSWAEFPDHDELQIESFLLECNTDKAPVHKASGTIKNNCKLTTDLSSIPKELFKQRSRIDNQGNIFKWVELHYELLVKIESGPMLFSLVCGGKEYGEVGTEY